MIEGVGKYNGILEILNDNNVNVVEITNPLDQKDSQFFYFVDFTPADGASFKYHSILGVNITSKIHNYANTTGLNDLSIKSIIQEIEGDKKRNRSFHASYLWKMYNI